MSNPGKSRNELLKLIMQPIEQLRLTSCYPLKVQFSRFWHDSCFFGVSNCNWSGFVQNITQRCSTQRKEQISFFPIIVLNPLDENCIYPTLLYICDQENKLRVEIPSITFDQLLWQQSVGIIAVANFTIVSRIDGFDMMMSFLGSIGNLMKGSGIEDLFIVNTVIQITS